MDLDDGGDRWNDIPIPRRGPGRPAATTDAKPVMRDSHRPADNRHSDRRTDKSMKRFSMPSGWLILGALLVAIVGITLLWDMLDNQPTTRVGAQATAKPLANLVQPISGGSPSNGQTNGTGSTAGQLYVAKVNTGDATNLNIRSGPDVTSPIIAKAGSGQLLGVLQDCFNSPSDAKQKWAKVRFIYNAKEVVGFASCNFLRRA